VDITVNQLLLRELLAAVGSLWRNQNQVACFNDIAGVLTGELTRPSFHQANHIIFVPMVRKLLLDAVK